MRHGAAPRGKLFKWVAADALFWAVRCAVCGEAVPCRCVEVWMCFSARDGCICACVFVHVCVRLLTGYREC